MNLFRWLLLAAIVFAVVAVGIWGFYALIGGIGDTESAVALGSALVSLCFAAGAAIAFKPQVRH